MQQIIFGFEMNQGHVLQQVDEKGCHIFPWIDLLAQSCGIATPQQFGPESDAQWNEYNRRVEECFFEHGCEILKVRGASGETYYACTLACRFEIDSTFSTYDIARMKSTMRSDLKEMLQTFCCVLEIDWQEPEWIVLRGLFVKQ